VALLKDVDAAIMLPGANPLHPAHAALQALLANERRPRRTVHFHWTDPYRSSGNEFGLTGIALLPGFPTPPMQVIDRVYQRAVHETDLKAFGAHQEPFAAATRLPVACSPARCAVATSAEGTCCSTPRSSWVGSRGS